MPSRLYVALHEILSLQDVTLKEPSVTSASQYSNWTVPGIGEERSNWVTFDERIFVYNLDHDVLLAPLELRPLKLHVFISRTSSFVIADIVNVQT